MATALKQIPEINIAKQIRPEKIPGGGFIWAVCFQLPAPAEADGHIIQHIVQEENGTHTQTGTAIKKSVNRRVEYWEAWEVKKGETEPRQMQSVRAFVENEGGRAPSSSDYNIPMNDIFYKKYAIGSQGVYTIYGLAGFYQQALTPDFIVGRPGAGALKSTPVKPLFWTLSGLLRKLRFNYNCETETLSKDVSKQTLDTEKHKLNMSYADSWF